MKRRILFVVTYFDCGGINRSLQNLLNRMDVNHYDVDVFGMVPDGMFSSLYMNCHVLPRHLLLSALMARYAQQKGVMRFLCMMVKVLSKVTNGLVGKWIKRNAAKSLKKRNYDAVVAFSEGAPTAFVGLMNHPNSVAWIHCDYASYRQILENIDERGLYSSFKHIVCVAEYPRQSFISCYPELATRTITIYNILDDDMMKTMAKADVEETLSQDKFNIVSVGRLDPVKRLSIIPDIAQKLAEKGCNFRWYVIGPKGGTLDEYDKLEKGITEHGLSEVVYYLGEQNNPYAYISRSDLLVNTSISEACPYVINEAKILHTPGVCTDFGSATEFIDNGVNGFICPIDKMADTIERYIGDKDLQGKIKDNLSEFQYDNDILLKQVYQIIG